MKKILFTFLLILSLVSSANAMNLHQAWMMGCAGWAAASCSTQEDAGPAENETANVSIGRYNASVWRATKLVVDSTYTICGIEINFTKVETPAGTLTACVYTDSTGPNTQVGDCSSAINESAIIANGNTYTFTVSASVSAGTYWIVLKRNAIDATNYFIWNANSTYCAGCVYSWGGSAWAAGLNQQAAYKTYK